MKRRTLALVLACFVTGAIAATTWVDLEHRFTKEQLHATGLDTLTAAQLAELNRLLRDDAEAAPAPVAASAPHAEREPERSRFIGFNDEPIESTLVGTLNGWEPGTEFALANGQRWKVLKGHYTLSKPLQAPKVKVVPGAAGRWFFRLDDDTPGARVYRVD
ncbi:hypothetical protein LYSHEL_06420 [Lysobacter helvus]|uniref:Secreted protein n=2 Tax=Lysobacteraceae TaxID=32033 RepID=A0ABN6FV62_9GAMM|nr:MULTISPECIES: hypothetical protein [Lysobacter]BCT91618.1 hypothetical protein LYSCAS_06420 [Lysobacter caseinilyticus]BCT94771.1 hypothetical protein LYSHEL_06420 [Lysobacter helvus]